MLRAVAGFDLTATLRRGANGSVASRLLLNPEVIGVSQDTAAQPAVLCGSSQPGGLIWTETVLNSDAFSICVLSVSLTQKVSPFQIRGMWTTSIIR